MSKCKWQLTLIFSVSLISYGKNIDDVIKEYEQKSYTTRINEANLKTYEIKDKLYKNGDWNEISITSNNEYQTSGTYEGVSVENTLKYGMLYYKNGYNFTNNSFTSNKVGISKSINDFFTVILNITDSQMKYRRIYRKLPMKLLKTVK